MVGELTDGHSPSNKNGLSALGASCEGGTVIGTPPRVEADFNTALKIFFARNLIATTE